MSEDQKPQDAPKPEPQVIDLEAEEVNGASDADTQPDEPAAEPEMQAQPEAEEDVDTPAAETASPPPPAPARKTRIVPWILGALVVGIVAGGWLYRGVLSSYLPTDEMAALKDRLDVIEANARTTGEQFEATGEKIDAAANAANAAAEAAKSNASGLAEATTRLGEIDTRIAAAEDEIKGAKSDLAQLRDAVSAGATASNGTAGTVDGAVLAALTQRIDELEKDVTSLKSAAGNPSTATTDLSQALADVKAKIAAGTPYADEYERIARMVPAAPGLDVLQAHASEGLPNAQGLAAELDAVIASLPQPAAPEPPAEDSYWNQFLGLLSGIVTVREIGEADWPELARKCKALAEAGDLTQAIGLIEAAEGTKPQELNQWHDRAAARLRLEAALGQVSEAVVRQITALGGAQ